MATAIPDFLVLSPQLAAKIAAVIVHADEMLSPDGHPYDREALLQCLADPMVREWVHRCGPLAPRKRSQRN